MRVFLSVIFSFVLLQVNAQVANFDHVDILIGRSKEYVVEYFTKLNNMSTNPTYKVTTEYTDNAQENIKVEYSLADEKYYKCISNEVIIGENNLVRMQLISFTNESASSNLNFLKSNFKSYDDKNSLSGNDWQFKLNENSFIQANFKKFENLYVLTYFYNKY